MNWETLLCLGDSITTGARSYMGYPEYLGCFLEEKNNTKWNVINHATNGFMCRDLIRSISENHTNLMNQNPSLITMLIGTNDVKNSTDLLLFQMAYKQLITKARLLIKNSNIYLIKIPSFSKGVKYPYTYSMNKVLPHYNKIIEKLAKENNLKTIELELLDEHYFDGVHLNETGSEAVAKQIMRYILQDKGYENIADKS